MKKALLILFLIISSKVYSQNEFIENTRTSRPFGINLNILGPYFLGFSADYYINSSTNIEAGIGLFGYFGGATYYFNSNENIKNWTNYVGLFIHHVSVINFDDSKNDNDKRNGLYIPLRLQYLSNDGLTFRIEIATGTILSLWGGLKFGYHF